MSKAYNRACARARERERGGDEGNEVKKTLTCGTCHGCNIRSNLWRGLRSEKSLGHSETPHLNMLKKSNIWNNDLWSLLLGQRWVERDARDHGCLRRGSRNLRNHHIIIYAHKCLALLF